ncbi:MSMEG_0565 family glycosyltransferase [Pseudonocardia halophobica]|uniref:Glycosyl transferase family 1 n=1 Tax=Pseudonocardia halophobica TaxID=29401 RepID=A0A9W6UFV0_9PSEU|nr:MSMEG_0565 family glycosyltransferase [Pseudonocardia halophobica]GLL15637.1 glycosyl transferase family 1 [Pseudonocardia halophobica]
MRNIVNATGSGVTRVALLTHSTSPRGGHVHTLGLGEALHRAGRPVHLFALGDPAKGLYRPVDVPHTIVPGPRREGTTLTERTLDGIERLATALAARIGEFDVLHAQDCIAARAALAARARTGAEVTVLRTAHHVDDFTTPVLVECQRRAITEPDRVLVVSEQWRGILARDFGVDATIVPNGVDRRRFADPVPVRRDGGRFLLLAVGGIEPRKGTVHAFRALARLRREGLDPMLAIVGGHSFQDFAPYREAALAELPTLGLTPGRDVVELGTLTDAELAGWYAAAAAGGALCYPSTAEGFGLVAIEAMALGVPVVASDLPVFREHLTDGVDALLPGVGDDEALAAALRRVITEPELRASLVRGGAATAARFTWEHSAEVHAGVYAELPNGTLAPTY